MKEKVFNGAGNIDNKTKVIYDEHSDVISKQLFKLLQYFQNIYINISNGRC